MMKKNMIDLGRLGKWSKETLREQCYYNAGYKQIVLREDSPIKLKLNYLKPKGFDDTKYIKKTWFGFKFQSRYCELKYDFDDLLHGYWEYAKELDSYKNSRNTLNREIMKFKIPKDA